MGMLTTPGNLNLALLCVLLIGRINHGYTEIFLISETDPGLKKVLNLFCR
jgi:hypothetical protein